MELEIYDLLYKWVPVPLRLTILFYLFFVVLTAHGVFAGNITDMFSSLGVYNEPYTQAANAMYIGMGLGLILHTRMKMRFSSKTLLIAGFCGLLLMNIICATSTSPTLTIIACLMIGMTKIPALIEVYVIWMIIWSKKLDTRRMYPFVYFTALCGLYFVTWLTTWLAHEYNWRFSFIVIFILLLVAILLSLIFVENHPLTKKLPLYQMDYPGLILLGAAMLLLNYAVVNGTVEDWLESKKIIAALFAAVTIFLLFLRRELTTKHPIFDMQTFKKVNFRQGALYFFLLGIYIPSTFQLAFSAGILHYEMIRNMELNLYLIPGIVLGCIYCYIWYLKELDEDLLIITGFLAFVVYHILMYNTFVTDFNIQAFWIPLIIKGFGQALLYISVGLLMLRNFSLTKIMGAGGAMLIVRSFLGSAVFSALYSYFLYAERIKRFSYLAGMTDPNDALIKQQGTITDFYRTIQEQAVLTASKELSGYIIISGIILLTILLTRYIYQKLMNRIIAS